MTKISMAWWSVFAGLTVAGLSIKEDTPILWFIWSVWLFMGISYCACKGSSASEGKKLGNIFIAASVLAVISYVREGSPITDDDGYSEGGYDADHKDRSGAAVSVFAKVFIGCFIGMNLAGPSPKKEEK